MIDNYNIIGKVLFSQSLKEIRQQLQLLRKNSFDPLDRIVLKQDFSDDYPYVDGVGTKLIAIQKIINQVDISNCFILLITANKDISYEIDFVTKFYSVDSTPMEFLLVEGEYEKHIKKYKNTACRKLWNHLYIGTDGNANPCCLADHRFPLGNIDNEDLGNIINIRAAPIRNDMMQGYRNRACAACYEKEDSNISSARQKFDPVNATIFIKDIDIRLSNICNFKCRMCSEYFSSAIQQETIELYGKSAVLGFEKIHLSSTTKESKNQRLEKILPYINLDLESIYFAGGEPLIMSEHYKILDRLIEIKHFDLAIRYNTNLSTLTYKSSNVIDKWSKFKNVSIGASIDASGKVAEYMRHGTSWDDIVTNIRNIKQQTPHVKLQISSTVSCLTIENLIDLQNQWIAEGLFGVEDFAVNVLTSPNFLSPAVLPRHHKDRLSASIQKHIAKFENTNLARQWYAVLQWINNNDYTFALDDFKQRTRVLDKHRSESFVTTFPMYKDLYDPEKLNKVKQ